MAHMALVLHGQHGFTHACATDGGKGEGPATEEEFEEVSERTSFGAVTYTQAEGRTARGGALPAGSTVQDAEMHALLACVRWASMPGAVPLKARRLFILSDSASQLHQVEKAFRAKGPRELRGWHRRGELEEFTNLRLQLGAVVTQFVRSHQGVYPNAHADMIATAFMRDVPVAGGRAVGEGGWRT